MPCAVASISVAIYTALRMEVSSLLSHDNKGKGLVGWFGSPFLSEVSVGMIPAIAPGSRKVGHRLQ